MKFTALPVNGGDSFLVETGKEKILVDTGKRADECLKLLKEMNIEWAW